MRYGITFALFAAFAFAGCSSTNTKTAPTRTARAAKVAAPIAYRPAQAPVLRTRTVTARPVAKTLTSTRPVARPFVPVGAPAIPYASTQRVVPTSVSLVRYAAPASVFQPASRAAAVRQPVSIESMIKPLAPLAVPGLEQCIGDECGVPRAAFLDD